MNIIIIALLGFVSACIGSYATWKISKRTASGDVAASTASDLWAEGGQIRTELRAELTETKTALKEAATAVTELKDEIRLSRQETHDAREETQQLKSQISALTEQITELHGMQMEALKEVKTGNTLTIAGLADNAETRRILAVPKEKRTEKEREHLKTAPDRLPDDQAVDQTEDKEMP